MNVSISSTISCFFNVCDRYLIIRSRDAVETIASVVTQKIFSSVGKMDEAQYLDLATKSGLVVTSLTAFAKVIKAIAGLG